MLTLILLLGFIVVPMGIYQWKERKHSTPALQWPILAPLIKMDYQPDPPRLIGKRNGRTVTIDVFRGHVRVATILPFSSRLRVEIAPKAQVLRKAGIVVPDPVVTNDRAFDNRLMARCSDTQAGLNIIDPVLRQRLLAHPIVDIFGHGQMVQWQVPAVRDPDHIEDLLDVLTVLATEMERFPETSNA